MKHEGRSPLRDCIDAECHLIIRFGVPMTSPRTWAQETTVKGYTAARQEDASARSLAPVCRDGWMRGRQLFSIQVLGQICGNLREDKKIYPDPAINRLPGTYGRGRLDGLLTLVSLAAVPSPLICPQWQRSPPYCSLHRLPQRSTE